MRPRSSRFPSKSWNGCVGTCSWARSVQSSFNQYRENGKKRKLFDEKTRRIWPNADLSWRVKSTREYVVQQFWTSFDEDKFDLDKSIQTKAEFSYAMAVMDRIGGWEEGYGQENWVG